MKIEMINEEKKIAAVSAGRELLLTDTQSALDLIATVAFETGCRNIIVEKETVTEDFFKLSTGVAGEMMQKFVNYGVKLAIVGDFSGYTSKSLRDFIYESNKGSHIFFVPTRQEAAEKLGA